MTDNPNLAPPGGYLLFVVDDCDIPSVALWVHLDRPPLPPPKVTGGGIHHVMGGHEHLPGFVIPGLPIRKAAPKAATKPRKATTKRSPRTPKKS